MKGIIKLCFAIIVKFDNAVGISLSIHLICISREIVCNYYSVSLVRELH